MGWSKDPGPSLARKFLAFFVDIVERRRIFNKMMAFIRSVGIQYKCFSIKKRDLYTKFHLIYL